MSQRTKKVATVLAAVASVAMMLVPATSTAAKKTKNFKMAGLVKVEGIKASGTIKGTPFGTCKVKGTAIPPTTNVTWTCKGGKIKVVSKDGHLEGAKLVATFTLKGVSGKYKKLKGKGELSGSLAKGDRTYKGTATY